MLEAFGLSKSYAGRTVLEKVDLSLAEGETVLVWGPNGAGKSTLARILAAFERPDAGEITLDGRPLPPGDVAAARRAGIWLVPQEPPVIRSMTAADNFRLLSGMAEGADKICQKLGVWLDWSLPASALPYKDMHLVSLVAALAARPSVLLLDETISALEQPIAGRFFEVLHDLAHARTATLVISHDLDRVAPHCRRILRLEQGIVDTPFGEDPSHVKNSGIGSGESFSAVADAQSSTSSSSISHGPLPESEVAVEIFITEETNLVCSTQQSRGLERLGTPLVNIYAKQGEIVGVCGDRHRSIVRALRSPSGCTAGVLVQTRGSTALVSHDFDRTTLYPDLSIRENLALALCLKKSDVDRVYESFAPRLGLESELHSVVRNLSGGNRQKVALIGALASNPDAIFLEEPLHSLDKGSRNALSQILKEFASRGGTVVAIVDNEQVLANLCDRWYDLRPTSVLSKRK